MSCHTPPDAWNGQTEMEHVGATFARLSRDLQPQERTCLALYVGGFSDKHTNEIEMLELPEALQPQGLEVSWKHCMVLHSPTTTTKPLERLCPY